MAVATPRWAQVQITLPPARRGCHLITQRVHTAVEAELRTIEVGLAHVFSTCLSVRALLRGMLTRGAQSSTRARRSC
jgi:transposase